MKQLKSSSGRKGIVSKIMTYRCLLTYINIRRKYGLRRNPARSKSCCEFNFWYILTPIMDICMLKKFIYIVIPFFVATLSLSGCIVVDDDWDNGHHHHHHAPPPPPHHNEGHHHNGHHAPAPRHRDHHGEPKGGHHR